VVRLNALNLTGHCFCCDKLCQLTTRHVARQCLVVMRYIGNEGQKAKSTGNKKSHYNADQKSQKHNIGPLE
jgi:hypothetical protein